VTIDFGWFLKHLRMFLLAWLHATQQAALFPEISPLLSEYPDPG
jgi:hypothetical protein